MDGAARDEELPYRRDPDRRDVARLGGFFQAVMQQPDFVASHHIFEKGADWLDLGFHPKQ